jgi:hypothetical protein
MPRNMTLRFFMPKNKIQNFEETSHPGINFITGKKISHLVTKIRIWMHNFLRATDYYELLVTNYYTDGKVPQTC